MTEDELFAALKAKNLEDKILIYRSSSPLSQELWRQCPPIYCYRFAPGTKQAETDGKYRSIGHPEMAAHLWIHSYGYKSGDVKPTLILVDGHGSAMAGAMVFGIKPEVVVKCDCGKFEPATNEDVETLRANIKKINEELANEQQE